MWEQNHSLFYGMKNICLATNKPIFVSTQATREAADVFTPPRVDQVAFGDALIRASDIALAMAKVEESDAKRMIQYQKYRDGVLSSDTSFLKWDVDKGHIEEINEFKTEDIEF
jgi:2,4-dienoyl-CoA reductase-like NADH-dependent reductase (Old Yellow Enzyme family)